MGTNISPIASKKMRMTSDGILHTRFINLLSHGNYSLYEPQEMLEENKEYFRENS